MVLVILLAEIKGEYDTNEKNKDQKAGCEGRYSKNKITEMEGCKSRLSKLWRMAKEKT